MRRLSLPSPIRARREARLLPPSNLKWSGGMDLNHRNALGFNQPLYQLSYHPSNPSGMRAAPSRSCRHNAPVDPRPASAVRKADESNAIGCPTFGFRDHPRPSRVNPPHNALP
jgi:hypothetical protein